MEQIARQFQPRNQRNSNSQSIRRFHLKKNSKLYQTSLFLLKDPQFYYHKTLKTFQRSPLPWRRFSFETISVSATLSHPPHSPLHDNNFVLSQRQIPKREAWANDWAIKLSHSNFFRPERSGAVAIGRRCFAAPKEHCRWPLRVEWKSHRPIKGSNNVNGTKRVQEPEGKLFLGVE